MCGLSSAVRGEASHTRKSPQPLIEKQLSWRVPGSTSTRVHAWTMDAVTLSVRVPTARWSRVCLAVTISLLTAAASRVSHVEAAAEETLPRRLEIVSFKNALNAMIVRVPLSMRTGNTSANAKGSSYPIHNEQS